jgi:hypothetical protein
MNTSLLSPRHNRPYRATISAVLRRCAGARVCNPRHRSSGFGAPPCRAPHSGAAGCRSALLATAVLLARLATPLRAAVIDDFSGPKNHAGTEVRLQWPNVGVLLEATAPAGPWKPWSGVVSEAAGSHRAAIPGSGQSGFYRLATGEHYLDLFDTQWATSRERSRHLCRACPASLG